MEKIKLKTEKKAQMNWSVFLAVVIIIVSFIVILFFYWQYNWKGEINKQTCHQSAVLKASMPKILDRPVAVLPLRCKTEKICITEKFFGTECKGFKGEKDIDVRRVSTDEKKQIEEIKDIIANSLYDCWSMMGEGKLDIFSREFAAKKYSSRCVICARIDFDNELKEELKGERGYISGLSEYLDTKPIPNKNMNYSQFLIGFKGERPYGQLLEKGEGPGQDIFEIEQQAIVFQEFDRTTLPEDITGVIGGIAAAVGVGMTAGKIPIIGKQLTILSFFGGSYVGRKGGSLIGGLIGDEYIASWAFAPYRVKSERIETEIVKDVTNDGKTCYTTPPIDSKAIPEGLDNTKLVYGFDKNKKFMFGKSGLSEKVEFPAKDDNLDTAKAKREFLNKVLEELTIKCYDLRSFQCDYFESYA